MNLIQHMWTSCHLRSQDQLPEAVECVDRAGDEADLRDKGKDGEEDSDWAR